MPYLSPMSPASSELVPAEQ